MRVRSYRALDRPLVFFGIRGRYLSLLGLLGALFLLPAVVAWNTVGQFTGFVVTMLVLLADWFVVTTIQGRMSHGLFMRMIAARRCPKAVNVRPRTVRSIFEDNRQ